MWLTWHSMWGAWFGCESAGLHALVWQVQLRGLPWVRAPLSFLGTSFFLGAPLSF